MNEKLQKKRILIVDDEEENVKLFQAACEIWGHESIEARNGEEAVEKALSNMPDLILMDVTMPKKDGFAATQILKGNEQTKHIPILILTARYSKEDILRGISIGADDYLIKPVDLDDLSLRVRNHLKIKEYHDFLIQHEQILEKEVGKKTRSLKRVLEKLTKAHSKIKESYIETIQKLARAAEYKDEDTGKHLQRIGLYVRMVAETMGMDEQFIELIYHAAPMHDVGKVGVPEKILLKPGPLTAEEKEIMATHTAIGARILSGSASPFLRMAEEIALSHHERWNGGGYPNGIKGEKIPLSARITNLTDQYDAMRSTRPYKPAFDHAKVLQILTKGDGRTMPEHFDPLVLGAFRNKEKLFKEIFDDNKS